ncbi:Chemotaxis regulator BdlA [Chromobacterium vaccinii]|nr:Chemotaxis regulator BdlA [Chromobacterium vaccinii]
MEITKHFSSTGSYQDIVKAIGAAQAVIQFKPDGTVIDANPIFLDLMGYSLNEVVGRHHGMFLPESEKSSASYQQFWTELQQGKHQTAQFRRIAKMGKMSGYRPPTSRSEKVAASPASSSSQPTSPATS